MHSFPEKTQETAKPVLKAQHASWRFLGFGALRVAPPRGTHIGEKDSRRLPHAFTPLEAPRTAPLPLVLARRPPCGPPGYGPNATLIPCVCPFPAPGNPAGPCPASPPPPPCDAACQKHGCQHHQILCRGRGGGIHAPPENHELWWQRDRRHQADSGLAA